MKENQKVEAWTRGTLAKAAAVGVETLRFYETKGLLGKPARNASGYRIYQDSDLERLRFIRRPQELGFSLQDIGHLLDLTGDLRTPRNRLREFAGTRLEIIRGKIRDLQAMERALSKLIVECDGKGQIKGCPIAEFVNGNGQEGACHE